MPKHSPNKSSLVYEIQSYDLLKRYATVKRGTFVVSQKLIFDKKSPGQYSKRLLMQGKATEMDMKVFLVVWNF